MTTGAVIDIRHSNFHIDTVHQPGISWLRLHGELDAATAPILNEALQYSRQPVFVDCGCLTFVDAAGLVALVETRTGNDPVVLVNPSAPLLRLLSITASQRFHLSSATVLMPDIDAQPHDTIGH